MQVIGDVPILSDIYLVHVVREELWHRCGKMRHTNSPEAVPPDLPSRSEGRSSSSCSDGTSCASVCALEAPSEDAAFTFEMTPKLTGHKLQPLQVIVPDRQKNLASSEHPITFKTSPSPVCTGVSLHPFSSVTSPGVTSLDIRGQKLESPLHSPCLVNGEKLAPPEGEQSPLPRVPLSPWGTFLSGEGGIVIAGGAGLCADHSSL